MKKHLLIIFILCGLISNAQKTKNYFVTKKGDSIEVYENVNGYTYHKYDHIFDSDYALTGQFLWYHRKDGKLRKIGQSKVKEAFLFGNYYTSLKIGGMGGFNRLHEIIVENSNYVMSKYYFSGDYYIYLIDKKNEEYIFKKEKISRKRKKDEKLFKEKIEPHFSSCISFIDKVTQNLSREYDKKSFVVESHFLKGITNMNCD